MPGLNPPKTYLADPATFTTYQPLVDAYINDINAAFRAVRNDLATSHPSGELSLTITYPTRMDLDAHGLAIPKITLRFYHYQSYTASVTAEGLEWAEVVAELFRLLKRDAHLKQITKRMED